MGVGSQTWHRDLAVGRGHARLVGVGTRTRRHFAVGVVTLRRLFAALGALIAQLWRPLAVVGLGFYGAWLIYRPAGYLTAAALLLIDLATDRST